MAMHNAISIWENVTVSTVNANITPRSMAFRDGTSLLVGDGGRVSLLDRRGHTIETVHEVWHRQLEFTGKEFANGAVLLSAGDRSLLIMPDRTKVSIDHRQGITAVEQE